jgi:hypothetical protein
VERGILDKNHHIGYRAVMPDAFAIAAATACAAPLRPVQIFYFFCGVPNLTNFSIGARRNR